MAKFEGNLRQNEIFTALSNLIISQQVFADNVSGTFSKLVDASRVDGSMYGDTKLYYSTDALKSSEWGNDAEAANLLATHRPEAPEVQAIVIDVFRQIAVTIDNYLSKRAFADEGTFSQFNQVMLGWLRDTKKIYDSTTFNVFVGNAESNIGNQNQTVELAMLSDNETKAQAVAEKVANILTELTDVTRDYNDYGHLRSYNLDDIIIVWSSEWYNKIRKHDLPTLFHKEGLIDKFGEYVLPARYFGSNVQSNGDAGGKRAYVEQVAEGHHYFAGDLMNGELTGSPIYTPDDKIICKIMHKRSIPYMSSFEASTSFFNPKSLSENYYLTWGHNELEYLKNYPMITLRADM